MNRVVFSGPSPSGFMAVLSFVLAVGLANAATAQVVLYRINTGGPGLAALDAGIPWDEDSSSTPSPFRVGGGGGNTASFTTNSVNASVPGTTPPSVFDTERWDPASGAEMQWSFPTGPGAYEVRLYFKDGFGGTSAPGSRVFDVTIEGTPALTGLDLTATYGHQVGVMEQFLVTTDATLDIAFIHVVENPLINAIEILSSDANGFLQTSSSGVAFGLVEAFTNSTSSITLTNVGEAGDQDIAISNVTISGDYSTTLTPQTLVPGGQFTFDVRFAPTAIGVTSETLTITHDGNNSPLVINLTGEGFDPVAAPVSFSSSGLSGESSNNPTSLDFGPDDRLYVAQQNGTIYAYDVLRSGPNDYSVSATETILDVKNIPNHNDDGSLNPGQGNRQVTGLLATGAASNPVLYVTSSDPRIAGGGGGSDSGLDTNSGIISRLTWDGASWDHVQLVRGLPRSEENHATNGLDLDEVNNVLYVMSGGHTNKGAPSNNFAQTPEYALSAAMLSIDLDVIEALPILVDGNGSDYVYDLPTLDDPTRGTAGQPDPGDPFGGNDGRNQALWDLAGPVQVYSPGYRNAFDVVFTSLGRLYTFDNGPNSGWGGLPIGEATANVTNASNESNSQGYGDGLHYVPGPGYYGGHPNPTRANPAGSGLFIYEDIGGTWTLTEQYDWTTDFPVPPVPLAAANPAEADYLIPQTEDGALAVINSSTNGIAEYTASNFGGQMQGNLLAAAFNGNIYRFVLNGAGDSVLEQSALLSGFGSQPLDVIALPDDGPFPGTIWAATYGADNITVFEPVDFGGGGGPTCTGANDSLLDEDNDGYSNADEIAAGTDPCNGGSQPNDNDNDFVSDATDTDDDNDGIADPQDPFAWDPANGTTTDLPFLYSLFNQDPGAGFFGLGFTGLMINGSTDYLDQFDENNLAAGGASGKFTVELVPEGDAFQDVNSQENAFQLGVNVDTSTPVFYARTRLEPPYFQVGGQQTSPADFQSYGLFLGTGDQDNYLKIVMNGNGTPGLQVLLEVGGSTSQTNYGAGVVGDLFAASGVELFLLVDPAASTVQPQVSLDNGATRTDVGAPIAIPPAWLDGADAQGLAIGLISTSTGSGIPFGATWDLLEVAYEAADSQAYVSVLAGAGLNASTFTNNSFQIRNDSPSGQRITSVSFDLSTAIYPDLVFDPNGTAGDLTAKDFTENTNGGVGTATHAFTSPRGNGGFDVLTVEFTEFDPTEQYGFSVDVDPTSIEGVGAPGPNESGSVSGLELVGTIVTVTFDDGTVKLGELYSDGSAGGSNVTLASSLPAAPGITIADVESLPSVLTFAEHTLRLTGPTDASVRVLQVEGGFFEQPGGGIDQDPFEANSAIVVQEFTGLTIDNTGVLDLAVTLSRSDPEAGINTFVAVIDEGGTPGFVSQVITVEYDPNSTGPPTLGVSPSPLAFGPVEAGTTTSASLDVFHPGQAGDSDITITGLQLTGPNAIEFEVTSPDSFVLAPGDSVPIDVSLVPLFNGVKSAALEITHTGQDSPLVVSLTGSSSGGTDPVWVYRVNAGGPEVPAIDNGPVWAADTTGAPSPFVDTALSGNATYTTSAGSSTGPVGVTDASVAPSTPNAIFDTERYSAATGQLAWNFPVTPGTYEVRLFFAEIYGGASSAGSRVLDVEIEGVLELDDFDQFVEAGNAASTGIMRSFTVASDDTLDIDLLSVVENASLKGIEILASSGPGTGVGDVPSTTRFALDQNQPNPFNPRTTISFRLARPGRTTLRIFDVSGRLVDVLADGALTAGRYEYIWDGVDRAGRRVATGVYFYRLQSEEGTETRKMTLVK